MSLPRLTQVRRAVTSRLSGLGAEVYSTRFRPVAATPAINVYIDRLTVEKQDNQWQWVTANLVIECAVMTNTTADEALDVLCEAALARIPRVLPDVWDTAEFTGWRLATGDGHSEQAVLIASSEIAVNWVQAIPLADVDTLYTLDDLETIAGNLKPDNAGDTMGTLAENLHL